MKLYTAPGTCALATQIGLREVGAQFDLQRVDLKAKTCADGDFKKINPKGYVPALKIDNGDVITEGAIILQWIADQHPEKNLLPKAGTMERYRAMEWLHYLSTEVHKNYSVLFNPAMPDEGKKVTTEKLLSRLELLDNHLKTNQYILGNQFSGVDAYAYTIISWSGYLKVDISSLKNIAAYMERVSARPSVKASRDSEKSA